MKLHSIEQRRPESETFFPVHHLHTKTRSLNAPANGLSETVNLLYHPTSSFLYLHLISPPNTTPDQTTSASCKQKIRTSAHAGPASLSRTKKTGHQRSRHRPWPEYPTPTGIMCTRRSRRSTTSQHSEAAASVKKNVIPFCSGNANSGNGFHLESIGQLPSMTHPLEPSGKLRPKSTKT